jgi:NAD-dependent dihydropyrimidine dehydrogenase PreA subunit
VGAITGEKGKVHRIDEMLCTKCATCVDLCKFQAIKGGK